MSRRDLLVSQNRRAPKGAGFGLVELMIAMTLGLAIILTVTTLFSDTSRTLFEVSRSGRQLENSLFTLDLLASELSLTGYWGEAGYPISANTQIFVAGEDIETAPSSLSWAPGSAVPPACLGTGAFVSGSSDNSKAELAYAMEYPVYAASGEVLNSTACSGKTAAARETVSDFVVIRRASTCATGDASCGAADDFFHLQINGCNNPSLGLDGGEIKLRRGANQAALASLMTYESYQGCSASATVVAPIYRYVNRIYYVDVDDVLTRLTLDNVGGVIKFVPEQLVNGVELLRFEWFVDSNGDGDYDLVTAAPTVAQWQNVVGVKIWIVTRSNVPEPGYTDDVIYTIAGANWDVPAGNEGYRRRVDSRTVDFPNIGGARR